MVWRKCIRREEGCAKISLKSVLQAEYRPVFDLYYLVGFGHKCIWSRNLLQLKQGQFLLLFPWGYWDCIFVVILEQMHHYTCWSQYLLQTFLQRTNEPLQRCRREHHWQDEIQSTICNIEIAGLVLNMLILKLWYDLLGKNLMFSCNMGP